MLPSFPRRFLPPKTWVPPGPIILKENSQKGKEGTIKPGVTLEVWVKTKQLVKLLWSSSSVWWETPVNPEKPKNLSSKNLLDENHWTWKIMWPYYSLLSSTTSKNLVILSPCTEGYPVKNYFEGCGTTCCSSPALDLFLGDFLGWPRFPLSSKIFTFPCRSQHQPFPQVLRRSSSYPKKRIAPFSLCCGSFKLLSPLLRRGTMWKKSSGNQIYEKMTPPQRVFLFLWKHLPLEFLFSPKARMGKQLPVPWQGKTKLCTYMALFSPKNRKEVTDSYTNMGPPPLLQNNLSLQYFSFETPWNGYNNQPSLSLIWVLESSLPVLFLPQEPFWTLGKNLLQGPPQNFFAPQEFRSQSPSLEWSSMNVNIVTSKNLLREN